MAAAMEAGKGDGRKLPNGKMLYNSPAKIIGAYQDQAKQDSKRLSVSEWREKYAWLMQWQRYAVRLSAPSCAVKAACRRINNRMNNSAAPPV